MPFVQAKSKLFEIMLRGETPLGIFISSLDPTSTEIVGDAGFDYVVLDNEHGRMGRIEVENHVRAAEAKNIIPFVRVLKNSQTLIQSMLDAGAQGIVVPHIDTAADARAAVAASLYAPHGKRGMCPACHAGSYTMDDWIARSACANENVMIIPILESRKSIENIEEILAVDGIDVVHFGPGDLSADMGIDFNTQLDQLMDAWHRALQATKTAKKRMLVPYGFGFDGADMLIAEMELMVLHRAVSAISSAHKASTPPKRAAN